MLTAAFFDRDARVVARDLLGKVIRHRYRNAWLACRIIETEAYYLREKGSHSSQGLTEKRRAMFMPAGTIYMYYARGGDSLNVSVRGKGNAVLVKAGVPWIDTRSPDRTLRIMQHLNPVRGNPRPRPVNRLCAGQTLLCRALNLKVSEWDQRHFDPDRLFIEDVGHFVLRIIQTTRLGIPSGRDEHLLYRFVDYDHAADCTRNPLTRRGAREGVDYRIVRARRVGRGTENSAR